MLLNRQIPVFTFFASNAVVNWQRAHGGRSSYKARRPQPDPTTTGILPLVASLARGTVLRCLYGVLCYSVYVPIFLYVDSAYRVSPCSLWENRRKQTRLSSHHSLPIRSFASLSLSLSLFTLFRNNTPYVRLDRREIFRNFFSFSRSGDDRSELPSPFRASKTRSRSLFFLSFSPYWPLVGTDRAGFEHFFRNFSSVQRSNVSIRVRVHVHVQGIRTRSRRGEIIRQFGKRWDRDGNFSSRPFSFSFLFFSFPPLSNPKIHLPP